MRKFGMQLFGITPVFNKNKTTFMERISKAGIRYLEPCLMLGEITDDFLKEHVWDEKQLKVNVEAMKAYGLHVNSIHYKDMKKTEEGYNDGCEYSLDGEYIWYCSTRSGYMQVFRMRRDGSEVTQMTHTEENNSKVTKE